VMGHVVVVDEVNLVPAFHGNRSFAELLVLLDDFGRSESGRHHYQWNGKHADNRKSFHLPASFVGNMGTGMGSSWLVSVCMNATRSLTSESESPSLCISGDKLGRSMKPVS